MAEFWLDKNTWNQYLRLTTSLGSFLHFYFERYTRRCVSIEIHENCYLFVESNVYYYENTFKPMARTSLGLFKFVRDMGSSNH